MYSYCVPAQLGHAKLSWLLSLLIPRPALLTCPHVRQIDFLVVLGEVDERLSLHAEITVVVVSSDASSFGGLKTLNATEASVL